MKEVIKERQGLYCQEFEHDNCGIGAVVNIKGKKSHDTVANALRIIVPEKMQKAKQVMALVSSFRFPINFLRKHVKKRESKSARKENMVLASSFSHSTRSNVPRQKKCLRSLWKKRDWSSLAGEKFR